MTNTLGNQTRGPAMLGVALAAGSLLPVASALAQAPAPPPPEYQHWVSSAALGATLTRGNTKTFTANGSVNSLRKWSHDEVLLGANVNYGENNNNARINKTHDLTSKSINGYGQWNHLFNERLYGGLRVDGLGDAVAGIDYRFTVSPLLGYYFIKQPRTTLAGEIGPSAGVEKVGVRVNGNRVRNHHDRFIGLRLGERFEHKFENGARIWQTAEIIPEIGNWDNYLVNFEAGVDAPLTKQLSARLVFQDNYDHEVQGNRLKNDIRLIAGLAYKF